MCFASDYLRAISIVQEFVVDRKRQGLDAARSSGH